VVKVLDGEGGASGRRYADMPWEPKAAFTARALALKVAGVSILLLHGPSVPRRADAGAAAIDIRVPQ
jgi:hypothetical protein